MKQSAELFWAFLKLGLFTIGGGMAMLPLLRRIFVEDKKWMTDEEMVDCIAVCQSLPGVIAINAATYIGKKRNGWIGSVAASIGVILPSFVIIILAVVFLDAIGENRYVQGAFTGIKAATCGLILYAAYGLGKQVLRSKFAWAVAIASFALIAVFGITAIWAIGLGAAAGLARMAMKKAMGAQKACKKGGDE